MESQQRAVSELAALKTLAATSKAIKRNHTKTVNVDFFAADEKNRKEKNKIKILKCAQHLKYTFLLIQKEACKWQLDMT